MMKHFGVVDNKKGEPLYYAELCNNIPKFPGKNISLEKINTFFIEEIDKIDNIIINKNKKIKNIDVVFCSTPNIFIVSRKFKSLFSSEIKGKFFYTNEEDYFLMIVDNIIDGIDHIKTNVIYTDPNYKYKCSINSDIFFNTNIVKKELIFSLIEYPNVYLCSERFQKMCFDNDTTGVFFDELWIS